MTGRNKKVQTNLKTMMDYLSELGAGMPFLIGLAAFAATAGAVYGYNKYKEFRQYRALEREMDEWFDGRDR